MKQVGILMGLVIAACSGDTGPTLPTEFLPVTSVSAGALHSCGLTPTGAVYCWGSNFAAQLGNGTQTDTTRPVLVSGGFVFSSLSAGEFHNCAVTTAGAAHCWGDAELGKRGDSLDANGGLTPDTVLGGLSFEKVSAGSSHTCGLTPAGAAYCWGRNYDGQLGMGTSAGPQICYGIACSTTPVAVAGGLTFADISAAGAFTCGVTTTHVAYCWGFNGQGELGVGTRTGPEICGSGHACSSSPVPVSGGLSIATISASGLHACAVTTAGKAYCWGDNYFGELGNGTRDSSLTPVAVSGGYTFSTVSAGAGHTCGITVGGGAVCWGANGGGRLGSGDTVSTTRPVRVVGGHTFAMISSGHNGGTTCAVTFDNVGYCWGFNVYGQLGNGAMKDSPVPGVDPIWWTPT